ncbi:hypothetical protein RCL1_006615 [Eukaryota sp. TZLM3-RCL]
MASVDDRVQYGPLKKLEVKNCVAYSGITCILGFLLFAFILMLIPGDAPEPPVLYGVISGVVLGPDNLPVENIEVSCPSFETVTTNAVGEFSLPEAVYGDYVLTINHPNYEQETVIVVLDASSVEIEISLTFVYGVISGVVLGPDNSPVENIEVSCPSFEPVTTNVDGEFSFPETVYGDYVLTINHPNYEQVTVNVVLDASNVDVEISLTYSPATVYVEVKHIDTNEPLSDFTSIFSCGGTAIPGTAGLGLITFNDVPRGTCTLQVTKSGFSTVHRSVVVNSLIIVEGVALFPLATLSVIVVNDHTNSPLPSTPVRVGHESVNTNLFGRATFNIRNDRTYTITVERNGYESTSVQHHLTANHEITIRLVPID